MKPMILAATLASVLLAASLLGVGVLLQEDAPASEAGADEALLSHGTAGDHHGAGMERPAFPPSEGSVPTEQEARDLEQVRSLRIIGDDEARPSNGIRSGSGSLEDPYVISDLYVTGGLYLQDTDACYEIKENFVAGQLSLNWNGQCVFVHHNFIRDLRVNENIRREGHATGGLLEQNKIEYIGQLRHYDGEFRHNVVGPRGPGSAWDEVLETVPFLFFEDPRVANIDGFNQGLIHHNTFHGSVDLDFHGHHHGTGFFAPHSHYHGMDDARGMEHDHTQRWTSVAFTDNEVIDPEGYGLRYEDRNHAGDDRMANSEQEETLREPHVHHVDIEIARNVVQGMIWVDAFIAEDRLHEERQHGALHLVDNEVELREREADGPLDIFGPNYSPFSAYHIVAARESSIEVSGNEAVWIPSDKEDEGLPLVGGLFRYEEAPTAFRLHGVSQAEVELLDNSAEGFDYGVRASQFDEATTWKVTGNDFEGALHDVWYDESVANEPEE